MMVTDDATKIARALLAINDDGLVLPDAWVAAARAKVARHALAEALLGIEATTVDEYRNRAHALAMNWKLEE